MNKTNSINIQKETIRKETEKGGEIDKDDRNESRFMTNYNKCKQLRFIS